MACNGNYYYYYYYYFAGAGLAYSVWLLGYEMDDGIPDRGKTSRISGSIPLLPPYIFTRKICLFIIVYAYMPHSSDDLVIEEQTL
jgi:hypothetical protein